MQQAHPNVYKGNIEIAADVISLEQQIVKPVRLGSGLERTLSLFVKGMRERKQPESSCYMLTVGIY